MLLLPRALGPPRGSSGTGRALRTCSNLGRGGGALTSPGLVTGYGLCNQGCDLRRGGSLQLKSKAREERGQDPLAANIPSTGGKM